jgi:hypothetical protein
LADVCVSGFIVSCPNERRSGDGGRDDPGVVKGDTARDPGRDASWNPRGERERGETSVDGLAELVEETGRESMAIADKGRKRGEVRVGRSYEGRREEVEGLARRVDLVGGSRRAGELRRRGEEQMRSKHGRHFFQVFLSLVIAPPA